uniref:LPXTG cell wall anchor domain-containing protein n=1 Tax=uncultured Gemella sp. TaxID=254352 RepID=UPI0028E4EF68
AAKPNAGNDIVKPADKTVAANPEKLTDAEKKAIEDKVKAVNPGATVVVDDKGNATVTTPEGKTAVIPATDLVKSAEDAAKPNAGNDIVKPADKTVAANPEKLTDAEKKAIEDKVKAVNPGATVVVDDKGNATVTTPEGKTAVIPATDLVKSAEDAAKPNAGNDIVKPADKTVVANPEKLTDAEKKAIEDKVKAVNPGATVVVDDKGNATVTTPEGKTAVIPATDLVKTFADPTENGKDNVNIPADKTVVANPEKLTDAEKKAIEDKVKAVNPGATVVVDDKGNATVTTPEGKGVVISATDLVKTSDATTKPNAGNDVVKPANKVLVKDPAKLTDLEKKAIENSVVAVNPGAYVTVDDEGNVVVTTRDGKTAVIPVSEVTRTEADAAKPNAGNDVNTPSAKTVVANPEKLTDAEKKAIEDKVKAVNPGATVVVDDKGNATVTTPEGKTAVIPATDLVKKAEDTTKENAGNDANTPAAKTVVANPEKLTDAEKKEIAAKVVAVNPGATVVVDDKGNATVVKGDGTVLEIPALDLVIPAEKLADEATNAKVKTPAVRTLVGDKEKLTDAEKEAVKKAIEAVNPGATVVVDDKGNATVTMLDGSTATISKEQLVKDKEDAKAKNGGDNLDFDLSKVEVTDLANITPEEKAKFQFMILGAITNTNEFDRGAFLKETDAQGNTVYKSKNSNLIITIDKDGNMKVMKDGKTDLVVNIDEKGNVTIVTKEGKVLAIPRDDAFKQLPSAPQYDGNTGNTDNNVDKSKLESGIQNLERLIASELDKLDATKAKEAKALLAEAKKVFAKADATQAEVDAMVKRLEEFKLSQASGTNADASGSNAQGVNAKLGQRLANTGTTETNTGLAGLGLGILGTLLAAARRRKEK